ncbi:hypothetical protein EKN65_18585 [Enterobacter cloacae]|nr:hypothetical protein EKN65_18585 [Enterobacter cloacae]
MPVLFEIFIIACGAIMKGLFIPGVTELGASSDSFPSGIVIPGANVMTLPPGEWVDLSDIDLTSSALDYRVSFSCASNHAYYSADGTIQFAAPDVWPLEYRNGVAVGRHEPEPQRTNLTSYSENLAANSPYWTINGVVTGITKTGPNNPYGEKSYAVAVTASVYPGVFARMQASAGQRYTISVAGISGDSRMMLIGNAYFGGEVVNVNFRQKTSTLSSPFTWRFNDVNTEWVRYAFTGDSIKSGTPATVIYSAEVLAGSYSCAMVQHESGAFATSPIITNGIPATRAAAFATVQNPGGLASAIMVHYSDNTSEQLVIPTNSPSIQLPQSANDWGKRYIQRIEYIR